MLKLKTFLNYKLEIGGVYLGYFSLVTFAIALVIGIAAAIFIAQHSCQDLETYFGKYFERDFQEFCDENKDVVIYGLIALTLSLIFLMLMAWALIKGTKNRNHLLVLPMMIVFGIFAAFFLGNVFFFTAAGVYRAILFGLIYLYNFAVIYSLFDLFRNEKKRGRNDEYNQPDITSAP